MICSDLSGVQLFMYICTHVYRNARPNPKEDFGDVEQEGLLCVF